MEEEKLSQKMPIPHIAFITAGLDEQYQIDLWKCIGDEIRRKGLSVTAFPLLGVYQRTRQEIKTDFLKKMLITNKYQGLIILTSALYPYLTKKELFELVDLAADIPVINLGTHIPELPSITINNAEGMNRLMEHVLTRHNPRKILYVSGPPGHEEADERRKGFLQAIEKWGRGTSYRVEDGTFLEESVEPAILRARKESGGIWDYDTLITANDSMALEAIRTLNRMRILVPEDTAVYGFDDIPQSSYAIPGLTTVQQPFQELGAKAVETVLELIDGRAVPMLKQLGCRLKIRESCGCREDDVFTTAPIEINVPALTKRVSERGIQLNGEDEDKLRRYFTYVQDDSPSGDELLLEPLNDILNDDEKLLKWYFIFGEWESVLKEQNPRRTILTALKNRMKNLRRAVFFNRHEEDRQVAQILRQTGTELLTAQVRDDICRILNDGLGKIRFGRFRLILFTRGIELFYAYPEMTGQIPPIEPYDLKKDELVYPPDEMPPFKGIFTPLFFNDETLGYLIMEQSSTALNVYFSLSRQLANTIKVHMLYKEKLIYTETLEKEVANRTKKLSETNERLSEEIRFRLRAEQEALEKEKKVRQILEALPQPVLICRLDDSQILYANEPYRRLLKIRGSLKKKYFYSHFKRQSEYETLKNKLLTGEDVFGVELPLQLPTGKEAWVSFAARHLTFQDEQAYIVGFTDRTRRKKLEDQVLTISDRERNRIGQDLHDDICQRLAGISILSGTLEKELRNEGSALIDSAAGISTFIRETIVQTKKLARGLYPVSLQRLGLDGALDELLDYYRNHHRYQCLFQNRLKQMPELSDEQKLHLYRIVQEALNNASRHSGGDRLSVILRQRAGKLIVEVRDNGIGMPKEQDKGLGLAIIHYRADSLGAEVTINAEKQGGTLLKCQLDLGET